MRAALLLAALAVAPAVALAQAPGAQRGGCAFAASDDCRASVLRALVAELDDYVDALRWRAPAGRFQAEHYNWLASSMRACGATMDEQDRTGPWIDRMAANPKSAFCALAVLEQRADAYARRSAATARSALERRSVISHSAMVLRERGKWYAEVEVKGHELWKARPLGIRLQVHGERAQGPSLAQAATRIAPGGRKIVGVAVDLDAGRLRHAIDGRWQPAGAAEGEAIEPAQRYALRLHGSASMEEHLRAGVLRLNTGERPFVHAPPDGFRPWGEGAEVAASQVVHPHQERRQVSRDALALEYLAWHLTRASRPDLRRGEAACRDGRRAKVIFLSGADAADSIERRCTVAPGTFLLLPLLDETLVAGPASRCGTSEATRLLKTYRASMEGRYVEIDGVRLDELSDFDLVSTYCIDIVGADRKPLLRNAYLLGNWVLLRPLRRGTHRLSFGGQIRERQVNRSVTYTILIR